jgi:hypothetical protein
MKLDVLCGMHSIADAWRFITPSKIKNCFVKRGFSTDHDSSNDDSAVKLTEDEEDDWYSLKPSGVQFGDHKTCDSALDVCEIKSVDQVLDQHLTRSEEEEEEVSEHEATFLHALKGLEETREYTYVSI